MTPDQYQRAADIYHAALGVAAEERSAFLANACAGDENLRREVELLLAANERTGAFIDRPAIEIAAPLIAADGTEVAPPKRVGRYEIVSPIGVGGMGTVYKARDPQLNRLVAIKFLSPDLADESARRRFQQEAKMASALNHPHILTVHEAGEFDGQQYLVTEFVDGGTLEDWSRAEQRSRRQIIDLLVGVGDGLAAAHAAGILHRDIKPGNILVSKNGYAKLADFGLAKLDEHANSKAVTRAMTAQTRPGIIVGTLAYMSPEQASGKLLDARSDIFSFGVVLYELLAQRRPFRGATDLEVLQTIIHGIPEPLDAAIPFELRLVAEKALENDPAERYQTMRDLVVDLKRVQRRSSQPHDPPVGAEALREIGARVPVNVARSDGAWRWAVVAATGVAVLLAGVLILSRRESAAPPWQNPLANATFTRLTDFEGSEFDAAISADGKWVGFVSDRNGPFDIWLGQIGSGRFVNLTQGAEPNLRTSIKVVGFSLDGSEVWLHDADQFSSVRVMPLTGGQPRTFLGKQSQNVAPRRAAAFSPRCDEQWSAIQKTRRADREGSVVITCSTSRSTAPMVVLGSHRPKSVA